MCEFDGDINSGSDSTLDTVDESSTDFGSDDTVPSELDTTGESGFDTPQNEYPAGGLWGPDPDYYGDGSYEGMWDEDTSAEETNERAREELDEFNRQQQEEEAEEQERMREEEEELAERQREEEESSKREQEEAEEQARTQEQHEAEEASRQQEAEETQKAENDKLDEEYAEDSASLESLDNKQQDIQNQMNDTQEGSWEEDNLRNEYDSLQSRKTDMNAKMENNREKRK
ncbi:hypothetical protein [Prevotella sp.]|uniref:hypothetical protein n=1 Tax=Prevotella sp. TaxID=59823 RepID=UPI002ABDF8D1|nr:hypothetical protein [Prevotella sp.]